jgi:hypothetical protein
VRQQQKATFEVLTAVGCPRKNLGMFTLKMKALRSFETSETINPTVQLYTSEGVNLVSSTREYNP